MGAHLQLVGQVAPPPRHEPRVLTASFMERLAQLNHARRELQRLGLQVSWNRLDSDKLEIRIARNKQESIAPLLDRMGPRSYRKEYGCTTVSGEFEGVIVSWVEGA